MRVRLLWWWGSARKDRLKRKYIYLRLRDYVSPSCWGVAVAFVSSRKTFGIMLRNLLFSSRCSLLNFCNEACRPSFDVAVKSILLSPAPASFCGYHTTSVLNLGRSIRKRDGGRFEPKKLSAPGESNIPVATPKTQLEAEFVDETTFTKVFNGVMFKDLPIINVKATPNNTLMNVTDFKGLAVMTRSCGCEGFKNARKSTNVAAQATGFSLGKKMMQKGYRTVRARVQGLGAGRMASLKGLTLAGVTIVSITDNTPVSWNPPRPRKQRRL